jgi:hypothetical protein
MVDANPRARIDGCLRTDQGDFRGAVRVGFDEALAP